METVQVFVNALTIVADVVLIIMIVKEMKR